MATQFSPAVASSMPPPFLLGGKAPARTVVTFADAMNKAIAAEGVRAGLRRPSQRIAALLWELGRAYGGRSALPLCRSDLANALGISLVRVKRVLGLLALSGVLSSDGDEIIIADWRKLSGAAGIDPADLSVEDEEVELLTLVDDEEERSHLLTASGDPACFV